MRVVYFAPEGFGYSSNQITEGLWKLRQLGDIQFWCTNKMVHHGSQIDHLPTLTDDRARVFAEAADIILFSSDGDMTFQEGIRGEVFRDPANASKLVFIDGHDSDHLLADPEKMLMYAKREYRFPEASSMVYSNVRGFTFGIYQFLLDNPPAEDDWDDRDIDISFVAFGGSNPARMEAADILKQLNGRKITKDRSIKTYVAVDPKKQPLSLEEYRSVMRRSKIGINIMGAGYDTLRFWETMAHGAVLASFSMNSVFYVRDAPEPHRHAIYFDSWNRMVELCRLVVCDRVRWSHMRRATDKLIQCHSTTQRARTLLQMAKELV